MPSEEASVTRRWRLADSDWNHWPDGLGDSDVWPMAAARGLDGVEVGVYSAGTELASERVLGLEKLTARHRVPVAAILLSLPVDLWPHGALTGDPAAVGQQVFACARACRRFGLATLGLWPGADLPGASYPALVTGLKQARDVAAALGVRVAVEYKPGTLIPDCETALMLATDVPGTGVLLDTGHAHAAGEDPAEVIGRLGNLLWHVHLGDAKTGAEDDDLPLGQVHDAAPLMAALAGASFAGVASFDLYGAACSGGWTGAGAVAASLRHLNGLL
jgi:sugar phosphate isomerase/epimerase